MLRSLNDVPCRADSTPCAGQVLESTAPFGWSEARPKRNTDQASGHTTFVRAPTQIGAPGPEASLGQGSRTSQHRPRAAVTKAAQRPPWLESLQRSRSRRHAGVSVTIDQTLAVDEQQ
jgi:hypothetical protein